MKFLLQFHFPTDIGNEKLHDPKFGPKLQDLLKEIKAEAVYLCPVMGERGGYIALSIDDPAKVAAIAEKFWIWLQADVEFIPVLSPEDLGRARPEINAAMGKYKE